MKRFSAYLLFAIVSVSPNLATAGGSKALAPAYPVKYEGGSLQLDHTKVRATVVNQEVVLTAGRSHQITVPAKSITEIAYGRGVRRRFGATVLDVVPFMHLGEAETHYVGVSWIADATGGEKAAKSEAVFRLDGSEYRDFLSALQRVTGKKAVDTNQVPTVVRYGL